MNPALEEWLKKLGLERFVSKREKLKHHFIFVDAPLETVAPQIFQWGKAPWWPKKCAIQFGKKVSPEWKLGARLMQRVRWMIPLISKLEITKLAPHDEIELTYLSGVITGRERLQLEGRYNGTKINYFLHYKIHGILNKLVWYFYLKGAYNENIEFVLKTFKEFIENKQQRTSNVIPASARGGSALGGKAGIQDENN